MGTEITSKRNQHSKTFQNDDGSFTTISHLLPLHWLAKVGRGTNPLISEWEEIDNDFIETDTQFIMKNHQFKSIINKNLSKNGLITITTDNGCSISQTIESIKLNEILTDIPSKIKHIKRTNTDNKYPNRFLDISLDSDNVIRHYSNSISNIWALVVNKNINYFKIITKLDLHNFKIVNDYSESDGVKSYKSDKNNSFCIESIIDKDDTIYIKQPKMWTEKSSNSPSERSDGISHTLEEINGIIYYTKEVTQDGIDWLSLHAYPYYIDTNYTVRGITYDGQVTDTNADYPTLRGSNGSTGTADVDNTTILIQSNYAAKLGYNIIRGFISFDTTAITAGSTINSAVVYLYDASVTIGDTTIQIVDWTGGSDGIANTDFDDITLATNMLDSALDITGVGGYCAGTLNASGKSNIVGGSYSDFCLTHNNHDFTNSAPAEENYVTISSMDETGTSQDPYISIDWTAPVAVVVTDVDGNRKGYIYLDSSKSIGSNLDKKGNLQYLYSWDFTSTDTKRNVRQKTKDFGT